MTITQAGESSSHNPQRWLSLAGMCSLLMLWAILLDGFVIAIPTISRELGGTSNQLAWAVTGYSLVACLGAVFGRLGDIHGNRKVLTFGALIVVVGSVVGTLSQTVDQLIVARVLQGLGGIAIWTSSASMVTLQFPPSERPRALNIKSTLNWAAGGFAVLVLALLLEGLGWRSLFWVPIPVLLLALAIVLVTTPEVDQRKPGQKIDVAGAITLTAACFALSYALIESHVIQPAVLVGLLALVVILLVSFAMIEHRAPDPLIPNSVWGRPAFSGSIATAFIYGAVLAGMLYLLALHLQTARGLSSIDAASVLLGATVSLVLVNPIGSRMVSKGSFLKPVALGMLLMAGGCVGVLIGMEINSDPVVLVGLVILGAAVGIQIASISLLQMSTSGATKGTASGIAAVTLGVGSGIGIALAVAVMQNIAIREMEGATGTHHIEGINHHKLLDVLTGSLPLDSVSAAGQKIVLSALDEGLIASSAVFAVLALFGAGLAILTLRNVVLDEEPIADATNSPELETKYPSPTTT